MSNPNQSEPIRTLKVFPATFLTPTNPGKIFSLFQPLSASFSFFQALSA
jgi:hypothetical protein